jgi:AraC-like DNA-binding protein
MKSHFQYRRYQYIQPNEQFFMNISSNKDAYVPHTHDFFELIYIVSGKGMHMINDKSFLANAGDVFLIRIGDTHAFHPLTSEKTPFKWINCLFVSEFINFEVPLLSETKYFGTDGFEIDYLFKIMIKEYEEKKSGYLQKIKGYLLALLTELSRMDSVPINDSAHKSLSKQTMMKEAVNYIRENYRYTVRMEEMASHLKISSSYLSKLFRECLNTSVLQYITQFRLEKSCNLLETTNWTIHQIALESGFNDEKLFRTYFRRQFDLTPGEYRKKFQLINQNEQ